MQKGLRMTESFPVKHHTGNEIINKNKRDKRQNEANASPLKNKPSLKSIGHASLESKQQKYHTKQIGLLQLILSI